MDSLELQIKEHLKGFFFEMKAWEVQLVKASRIEELNDELSDAEADKLDKLERRFQLSRNAILRRFCAASATRSPLNYGKPPRYDPKRETIASVKIARDQKTAVVVTECRNVKDKLHHGYHWDYELKRKGKGWVITRRRVKFPGDKRFDTDSLA